MSIRNGWPVRLATTRLEPLLTAAGAYRCNISYGLLYGISLILVQFADRGQHWVDEQITRELIHRWNVWELLTVLPLHQPHYPTFYLLPELAGWQATRFVSLLALPVTVAATARAARALDYPPRAAFLAAALVATSPYLAVQASWIRMYAPLTALLTVGFWLALASSYRRATVVMMAAAVLHPFGAFGPVWLALNLARRHRWRSAAGIGVLGCLPAGLFVALRTGGRAINTRTTGMGHGIEPSVVELALTPVSSVVGSPHLLVQVTAVAGLTLLLLFPRGDVRVWAWVLLPVVGISLASYLVHPVFRLKYFGFIAPAVAVLAADPQRGRYHRGLIGLYFAGLLVVSWVLRSAPTIVSRRFIFWF